MNFTPPRAARRFLRRLLPLDCRDDVAANLDELFGARVRRAGRLKASAWYWRQAISLPLRLHLTRTEGASTTARSGGLGFGRDVRFAARVFRREPAFAFAASGTLALGLAANVLVFAVISATMLRPLPWPQATELVWLWPNGDFPLTLDQLEAVRDDVAPTVALTGWASRSFILSGGSRPVQVTGVAVSDNHFSVLGIPPTLGRPFTPADARPGGGRIALISHAIWRDWFGADPSIVGREVRLEVSAAIPMVAGAFTSTPLTVIGVLPSTYRPFGFDLDIIVPLIVDPADPTVSNLSELAVLGRLRDGAPINRIDDVVGDAVQRLPEFGTAEREAAPAAGAIPLREATVGGIRDPLLLSLGVVGLVLLLACANVAHLVLARLGARTHELAMRYALGATRGRIARHLLAESLVLSAAGGLLGLALAFIAMPGATALLPSGLGIDPGTVSIDGRVLAFVATALVATTFLVGLLPVLRSPRDMGGARGSTTRRLTWSRPIVHQALVAGEVALALTIVCAAGLMLESFGRLSAVDPGFEARDVATMRVAPSSERYSETTARRQLYGELIDAVRRLPGVESAAAIHFLPIADGGPSIRFRRSAEGSELDSSGYRVVVPGYFETIGMPIRSGRSFTDRDAAGTPLVGLINQQLASVLWPGEDALGRTVYRTDGRVFFEVIGVTGDVRQQAIGLPPAPEIYLPLGQTDWASAMTVVVRAPGRPATLLARLDDVAQRIDPSLPTMRVAWMDDLLGDAVTTPRFYGAVFSTFGLLAVLLGGVGVYGVSSFLAGRRRREIGIRLALGATRASVLRLELGRTVTALAAGLLVGLGGAVAAGQLLSDLLFEVSPFDPGVLLTATTVLTIVSLASSWIPARRAVSEARLVSGLDERTIG